MEEEDRPETMSIASSSGASSMELDEEDRELIRAAASTSTNTTAPRKTHKRQVIEDSDDDQLEDNVEQPKSKQQRSLESMFDDDTVIARPESTSESEEGLEDFIEEQEEAAVDSVKKPTAKAHSWGSHLNISKSAWTDLMDIFGDGTDYADLVWEQDEEGEDSSDGGEEMENGGILEQTVTTLHNHAQYYEEEARYISRHLQQYLSTDADQSVIITVLRMLVEDKRTVPFMAAFKRDQVEPFSLYHLWAIYDVHQQWCRLKSISLQAGLSSVLYADILVDWKRKMPVCDGPVLEAVSQWTSNVKAWAPLYSISNGFSTDQVLSAMLSSDAIDVIVKRIEDGILVSTEPTDTGRRLGTRHYCAHLISLHSKPLPSFTTLDLFLVSVAVAEGWCSVRFKANCEKIVDQLGQLWSDPLVVNLLVDGLRERIEQGILQKANLRGQLYLCDSQSFDLQSRLTRMEKNCVLAVGVYGKQCAVVKMSPSLSVESVTTCGSIQDVIAAIQDHDHVITVSGQGMMPIQIKSMLGGDRRVLFCADDYARLLPKRLADLVPMAHQQPPVVRYTMACALWYLNSTLAVSILSSEELCELSINRPYQQFIDSDLMVNRLQRAIFNACCYHTTTDSVHQLVLKQAKQAFGADLHSAHGLLVPSEHVEWVERLSADAQSLGGVAHLDLQDYSDHLGGGVRRQLEWYRRRLAGYGDGSTGGGTGPHIMEPDELFAMLAAVRPDQLQPGQLVRVSIPMVQQSTSTIGHLESSQLPVKVMLDDKHKPPRGGQLAVILSVNYSELVGDRPESVSRVMRVSVHADDLKEPSRPYHADQYYQAISTSASTGASAQSHSHSQSQSQSKANPLVHHPLFNPQITCKQAAIDHLKQSVSGDAVLWSDSNTVILSWRCCQGMLLVAHWPITMDTYRSVSTPGGKYEDVDELVARGVEPTARALDQVVGCPKYIPNDGTHMNDTAMSKHVESVLTLHSTANPGRIAYGFWLSMDHPATVYLSLHPRHHEAVPVVEGEFVFRRVRYKTISAVVDHLKRG